MGTPYACARDSCATMRTTAAWCGCRAARGGRRVAPREGVERAPAEKPPAERLRPSLSPALAVNVERMRTVRDRMRHVTWLIVTRLLPLIAATADKIQPFISQGLLTRCRLVVLSASLNVCLDFKTTFTVAETVICRSLSDGGSSED